MRLIIKNIKVKLVDESKHHSRNEQDSKMADVMPLKFVRSGIEAEIDEVCGDSEQVQHRIKGSYPCFTPLSEKYILL